MKTKAEAQQGTKSAKIVFFSFDTRLGIMASSIKISTSLVSSYNDK